MEATRNRRLRYGLRTLLILVALSAVGAKLYRMLPGRIDVKQIRPGMTSAELRFAFGEPEVVMDRSAPVFETWRYLNENDAPVHLRLRKGELMYWWMAQ